MPDPSIFTNIINQYLPEPHASLLNGIIFGIPLSTTKSFSQQLRIVGLLHLVVLSGMNITLLGAAVAGVMDRFGKRLSSMITIIVIIFFIIFVGPQAPIVRAGIMGIITLVAIIYGRQAIALYTLVVSALLIALFIPEWISTISFQLSFGATLGIILLGKFQHRPIKTLADKIYNDLWSELRPSLAAQIFTAPIIFLYFKQVSLIAPLSNLLVAPLVAPLMLFGFMTAILGSIHYSLGLIPALISYGMLQYMVLVIEILSKVPLAQLHF